jgi:hypothetical protein
MKQKHPHRISRPKHFTSALFLFSCHCPNATSLIWDLSSFCPYCHSAVMAHYDSLPLKCPSCPPFQAYVKKIFSVIVFMIKSKLRGIVNWRGSMALFLFGRTLIVDYYIIQF